MFNLEDENDTSDDASINDVSDTVINVCRESALNFMSVVVQTMIHYHKVGFCLFKYHSIPFHSYELQYFKFGFIFDVGCLQLRII